MPFNPVFDAFVSSPAPSANSNLRLAVSLPGGNHVLGSWSIIVPNQWGVASGNQVFDGDVVGKGTMSLDTDCDGSIQTYGPFDLVDLPSDPSSPYAEWSFRISNWWDVIIAVNADPGEPLDMSTYLPTGISVPHALCAPQTFIVTISGRSSPHNDAVLSNPNAGTYNWQTSLGSKGGEHIVYPADSVCVGNSCDYDGDGTPDISDNCRTWPNPTQSLPPWAVPANDPDCDGFSSSIEDPVGTNALVQCGTNDWPADVNNDTVSDISDMDQMAANFGLSVPPAAARHDVAPEPQGDDVVDISDIDKLAGVFGLSCAPCPSDMDCDSIVNGSDNCPNWPNPAQNLPPWPIPPNDPDCDGFSSAVEISAGTNPATQCGTNAWPADINNDRTSDISDIDQLAGSFGLSAPPAPERHDIAPDPTVDNVVDISDIDKLAGLFGLSCV